MKKRYAVSYCFRKFDSIFEEFERFKKGKKPKPPIEYKGGFVVFAIDQKDAEIQIAERIRELVPFIRDKNDGEILKGVNIYYEGVVDDCYLCGKILTPNKPYFEIIVGKTDMEGRGRITFCSDCWLNLMDEINIRRYSSQKTDEN
jgi:hypothetical protein